MPSSSSTTIRPLRCHACSATVPLPQGDEASCDGCGANIQLPSEYRALRDAAASVRLSRHEAEQRWREIPAPLPSWAAEAAVLVVVVITAAFTTVSLIGWVFCGWFESVRDMLVLGVFTPLFGLIWGLIETIAARSHARYVDALSAHPPAERDGQQSCRMCGAPLIFEPEALAATCGYCHADSLVTRLSPGRRGRLRQMQQQVAQQLGPAVVALEAQRGDQRLVRTITLVVLAVCWLGFWFGLPH